jgi:hypothetical protein
MDLYCPIPGCGEPWDNDELHEVAKDNAAHAHTFNTAGALLDKEPTTYAAVLRAFQAKGCEALGAKHNIKADEPRDRTFGLTASEAASALYDILGDDADGAAAMLEDMGF